MEDAEKPVDLDPLLLFPMIFSLDELKKMKRLPTRTIYEISVWTPGLRERVAEYLRELPEEQYAALLPELEGEAPGRGHDEQVAHMTTENSPSSLASSVHYMAVKTVPTLRCLIESVFVSPDRSRCDYE